MKLIVPPAPRGPDEKEGERAGAQSRVKGAEQKDHAKGPHRGARQGATGADHIARDHLVGRLVRIVFALKEPFAGVTPRAAHDARAQRRSARQHRRPRDQGPGVRAKGRETSAVTLREFGTGRPVAAALLPPLWPRPSSGVGDVHGRVVTNEPALIVQSPHEVDVFADAK